MTECTCGSITFEHKPWCLVELKQPQDGIAILGTIPVSNYSCTLCEDVGLVEQHKKGEVPFVIACPKCKPGTKC